MADHGTLPTRSVRRRNLWCWLGLHRWHLGVDVAEGRMMVAMCSECGRVEVVSE